MAGHRTSFRHAQSIAGAILVGLGTFVLHQHLAGAVVRLSHVLAANGSEALGMPPAVIQTIMQVLQAYATDHQRFVHILFQQMLVLSWPLLLVVAGTVLSRESFRDNV